MRTNNIASLPIFLSIVAHKSSSRTFYYARNHVNTHPEKAKTKIGTGSYVKREENALVCGRECYCKVDYCVYMQTIAIKRGPTSATTKNKPNSMRLSDLGFLFIIIIFMIMIMIIIIIV